VTSLVARLPGIQQALDALARRHRVPGATLAIAQGDELVDFATGVLNVTTGVEATTDSVFQIGSNTKLFTATLVMQLVDEGKVSLDAPVRQYLEGFCLADPAADQITVRHLLTHTSGIQGDYFKGFGRGDDAIARYVDSLKDIDLVHPPGALWSYCNSGFVVAGRLAEVVAGAPFHQLLAERICRPLELSSTTVRLDEMIARRCAVGHLLGVRRQPIVPATVVMEHAQAPAGSVTTASASELVRFVQMHLNEGAAPDGRQVLSGPSVRQMQEVQTLIPATSTAPQTQGIGWLMHDWDGTPVLGHGGGTIGQLSFLECIPQEGVVVALLTNSVTGGGLWRDLGRWLFEELAGVTMSGVPKAANPPPALDLDRYAGTYERLGVRYRVQAQPPGLAMHVEVSGELADLEQRRPTQPPIILRPIDSERFVARIDGTDSVVAFLAPERGRPRYLFTGRVARRVAAGRPRGSARAAPGAPGRRRRPAAAAKTAQGTGQGPIDERRVDGA